MGDWLYSSSANADESRLSKAGLPMTVSSSSWSTRDVELARVESQDWPLDSAVVNEMAAPARRRNSDEEAVGRALCLER